VRSGEAALLTRVAPLLLLLALAGLLAPGLAPFEPSLPTGLPLRPPGDGHLFGTNDIGQDVFSQWLYGARASLLVALTVAALSTGLAWGVGIAAVAWRAGSGPLLLLTDVLLALPSVPLLMLVVALVGPSQLHVVLALGVLTWPAFARIVRARVLGVVHEPYVEAARAIGATPWRVACRHVAPATLELLPAKLVLTVRLALFAEATLAFLGLGDPAAPSWGTMLGRAFSNPLVFVGPAWTWWVVPPAAAIVAVVLLATWVAGEACPDSSQAQAQVHAQAQTQARADTHTQTPAPGRLPTPALHRWLQARRSNVAA
jgi:ABC-type dipeptide/oligopeptide/nickel transport system permease subunit